MGTRRTKEPENASAPTRLGGDIRIGPIPKSGGLAHAHFQQAAENIVSEWLKRRAAVGQDESSTSWFKRNLYRLIKAYVDAGDQSVLLAIAKRSGRAQVGLHQIAENPFKLALFGMWSDNASLTRQQQRVFGEQMLYAYRHDVPPEHLIGFIRVAGNYNVISQKLRDGAREPGFD